MKKKILSLFIGSLAVALSGCASSSDSIDTSYVSPRVYKDYTCDELAEEGRYVANKVEALSQSLDKTANLDTAQMTSAILLTPFTLGSSLFILGALEGGDGVQASEFARMKGEYAALYEMSKKKKCRI